MPPFRLPPPRYRRTTTLHRHPRAANLDAHVRLTYPRSVLRCWPTPPHASCITDGNRYSGYHADLISFMYLFYDAYPGTMNAPKSRSMSFSHETSAATVAEAHCYGAGIGASLVVLAWA